LRVRGREFTPTPNLIKVSPPRQVWISYTAIVAFFNGVTVFSGISGLFGGGTTTTTTTTTTTANSGQVVIPPSVSVFEVMRNYLT